MMMHDWVLLSLEINWVESKVVMRCRNQDSIEVEYDFVNFVNVRIPKKEGWGSSASINNVSLINSDEQVNVIIRIEVQSGDIIEIEAERTTLPV